MCLDPFLFLLSAHLSFLLVSFLDVEAGRLRKNRSEEKFMGFSSASLFPARKRETVTKVEIEGQYTTQRGELRELILSKATSSLGSPPRRLVYPSWFHPG